jgi:hypothetical protein
MRNHPIPILILSGLITVSVGFAPGEVLARTLKGTISNGRYIAPDRKFSFPVPANAKVKDDAKTIPVSRLYLRAFYPVPADIKIPQRADWFTVSVQEGLGSEREIHHLPITGDGFSPLPVGLHQRTLWRFLYDLALPEWFGSISKEGWVGEPEFIEVDRMDALFTGWIVPPEAIKGLKWSAEGTRLFFHFGILVFIKGNDLYMLSQPQATNGSFPSQSIGFKEALIDFYRTISFEPTLQRQVNLAAKTKS